MIGTMGFSATEINNMELDELFITATCRIVNQVNEAAVNRFYSKKARKPKR